MTTYGTIPTITTSSDDMGMMRSSGGLLLGTRRPWKEMLFFSLPESSGDAFLRIKTNSSYFHMNYLIIILFVIFLSLLWHPVSLVVFLLTLAAWLFLYFLRDNPMVIFGYIVNERVVLTFLSMFTMVLLISISSMNVVSGLAIGVATVAHGALRRTDDLTISIDEEEQWPTIVHLKELLLLHFLHNVITCVYVVIRVAFNCQMVKPAACCESLKIYVCAMSSDNLPLVYATCQLSIKSLLE